MILARRLACLLFHSQGKNELFLDEIIQQEKATLSWLQNQTKHEEEEKLKNERLEKEKLIEVTS